MSSYCSQLNGWIPSGDGAQYDSQPTPTPSQGFLNSQFSSPSSFSDPNPHPLCPSGKSIRRQHEPGWVARPRNAFIIFRCDYSQIHRRRGRRIRRPPGVPSTDPSLSKRAAMAWKQMTAEEKEPYRIRAEQERDDHVRNNPDYRFRPQRHPGTSTSKSRCRPRSPLTPVTDKNVGLPTQYTTPLELSTVSAASSPTIVASPTAGESQYNDNHENQYLSNSSTRWIHPIACNVSASAPDGAELPVDMMPVGHIAPHFDSPSSCSTPETACSASTQEIPISSTAAGKLITSNAFVSPPGGMDIPTPSPTYCEGYYETPYETQQHPSYTEGFWYGPTGSYYTEQMNPGPYYVNWNDYGISNVIRASLNPLRFPQTFEVYERTFSFYPFNRFESLDD